MVPTDLRWGSTYRFPDLQYIMIDACFQGDEYGLPGWEWALPPGAMLETWIDMAPQWPVWDSSVFIVPQHE
jgi:hypothetical protein